jgi:hypothetical protein
MGKYGCKDFTCEVGDQIGLLKYLVKRTMRLFSEKTTNIWISGFPCCMIMQRMKIREIL